MKNEQKISDLINNYKNGYSLEQSFYKSKEIYDREICNIFHKNWILAGHISQIPTVGDYFLFEFDKESIIVTRNKNDEIKAHINVCRHRGSHICIEKKGSVKAFTCPYHAWSYDLDGELMAARLMSDDFNKSENGLHSVNVELVGGLIFISLAKKPLSLANMREDLADIFELYGFDHMKLAKQKTYPIAANWKLALENYQECYHCTPSHKEYAKIHALALPPSKFIQHKKRYMDEANGTVRVEPSDCYFDLADIDQEGYQYDRHPLLKNMKSGSLEGKPVSRLLGKLTEYEGGSSEFMVGPVTFFLVYDDYMVGYRFLPTSVNNCICDVFWFVNDEAIENKDYDLDKLTWLWDVTTQADEEIIVNNSKGVDSNFYKPGKLSEMETFQQHFLNWYQDVLRTG